MKKSLYRVLALAVMLALAICVLSGCSDNTQAKIDEAVSAAKEAVIKEKDDALAAAQTAADEALKSAQEAADAAKAELEGQVTDLTAKLTAAEEAAKTAAETAAKEKDEAVAAAKTELETQVTDLTAKLTAAEEAAKTAAEAAVKEKDEAVAAAKAEAEEAAKTAAEAAAKEKDEAVAAAKAELETQVADLTKQVEDVTAAATEGADAAAKAATEAAEAAKAELEAKVTDLEAKLAAAEEAAKTAAETAAKDKEEAVAAVTAEMEAKIAELQGQLEAAAAAAETKEEPAAEEAKAEEPAAEEAKAEEPAAEAAVMSHADYDAAELDTEVCVETYVQATQSWWDGKITVYAQSEDGAYFIYNMACTEEDAAKLVPGAKIRVKGFKSAWAGEVEITDASFEFIEADPFIAEPEDVTAKIGSEELINCQNELVTFKGLTVEAQDDGAAFNYKDPVGKTDDLYFKASKDGQSVSFCVEFYLCGQDTDVYKAVEGLKVGDVIDVTGYLYWYEGANPHVIAVAPAAE